MVFENGVKNIQAAAYNGARTVIIVSTLGFCLGRLQPGLDPGTPCDCTR